MALESIHIRGFKSIRDARVELKGLNVLIGANGAGKSNFIQAFALLRAVVDQRLDKHVLQLGGAARLLNGGPKVTSALSLEVAIRLGDVDNQYEVQLIPVPNDTLAIGEERGTFSSPRYSKPFSYSMGAGPQSSLVEEAKRGPNARLLLATMVRWQLFHFHDTSPLAQVKQSADIDDNEALRTDAANLAPFLWRLQQRHPESYGTIRDTIRRIAPYFRDFRFRERPGSPRKMLLEWEENGSDRYCDAHTFSDGTLRFICLTTLLLQPNPPSVILIDEPELGLHPEAIQLLAALMRSVAQGGKQLVVATQSVTLVNQLTPEDLIVVDRDADQSVFRRPTADEATHWLEHYALGDLWEKNLLGGTPG